MPSAKQVCGTFNRPTNPNLGGCAPRRLKISCEAPVVPTPPCNGEIQVIYDPDSEKGFRIIATVYDSNCSPIYFNGELVTVTIQ